MWRYFVTLNRKPWWSSIKFCIKLNKILTVIVKLLKNYMGIISCVVQFKAGQLTKSGSKCGCLKTCVHNKTCGKDILTLTNHYICVIKLLWLFSFSETLMTVLNTCKNRHQRNRKIRIIRHGAIFVWLSIKSIINNAIFNIVQYNWEIIHDAEKFIYLNIYITGKYITQ